MKLMDTSRVKLIICQRSYDSTDRHITLALVYICVFYVILFKENVSTTLSGESVVRREH